MHISSFIDVAKIKIRSGSGGSGCVSFAKSKARFPTGGNGGKGGDIIFKVDNSNTLQKFRHKRSFFAQQGQSGSSSNKVGRNAPSCKIGVPIGTQVYVEDEVVYDLCEKNSSFVILKGGNGGFGNFATRGMHSGASHAGAPGEDLQVTLKLKIIADIALVGMPNVGKSTLLNHISNTKCLVGNYAFTTRNPILGTVAHNFNRVTVVDLPGIIDTPATAKSTFVKRNILMHAERAKYIIHVLDSSNADYVKNYNFIREKIAEYSEDMLDKVNILALSKTDGNIIKDDFLSNVKEKNVFKCSCKDNIGIDNLIEFISTI